MPPKPLGRSSLLLFPKFTLLLVKTTKLHIMFLNSMILDLSLRHWIHRTQPYTKNPVPYIVYGTGYILHLQYSNYIIKPALYKKLIKIT